MKLFIFNFDITGQCALTVEAEDLESAVAKVQSEEPTYELLEWNVDKPTCPDEIKKCLIYMVGK